MLAARARALHAAGLPTAAALAAAPEDRVRRALARGGSCGAAGAAGRGGAAAAALGGGAAAGIAARSARALQAGARNGAAAPCLRAGLNLAVLASRGPGVCTCRTAQHGGGWPRPRRASRPAQSLSD